MSFIPRLALALYHLLVHLHPPAFRATFADEMVAVFAARVAELPPGATLSVVRLCTCELGGLLASLAREHLAVAPHTLTRAQRVALVAALLYVALLSVSGLLLLRASPAPQEQQVVGLAIGRFDGPGGITFLSGRRLQCERIGSFPATFTTRCQLELFGERLEILARRNPPSMPGGFCEAHYAGRPWGCRIGQPVIGVDGFAYLGDPLGLSTEQLAQLRREHWIENLPEQAFVVTLPVIPTLSALLTALALSAWFWHHRRWRVCIGLVHDGLSLASVTPRGACPRRST